MKTAVIKRSIFINGRKTSVSLENEFWAGLHDIAKSRKTTAAELVGEIDRQRTTVNLSSAIRIYVYNYFRSKEGGHAEGNPAQHHLDGRSLRAQADKYRGLAEGLKDTETRTSMLRIAEDYEQMAASAEQLEGPTES
ncbi:MAG: ribbon-helix-helix domain-containing protein [Pseudolabrys sp.]